MTPARLLLVEFLRGDRFAQYRSELHPFLAGYARAQAIPVRWVAFGLGAENEAEQRFIIDLDDNDAAALCRALTSHAATHLLANERLAPALRARIEAHAPGLRIACLEQGSAEWETLDALHPWLGLPPPAAAQHLFDVAMPDYACDLLNDRVAAIQPLIELVSGPVCYFARSLRDNPHYKDLSFPEGVQDRGCAFCGNPAPQKYPYRTDPVDLALRQLRAAIQTCPPERYCGEFLVSGVVLFLRLRAFADAVLAADLPPVRLLFSCRVDELLRLAPVLNDLLPRLAAAGHSVCIQNMGVESFSRAENERFGKHISVEQVAQAIEHLTRWEKAFPDHFFFWKYGGFGFIMFTPWTTLDDLDENLAAIARLGIRCEGLIATSRLILMPGRAISVLAQRDGALESQFADSATQEPISRGCVVAWNEIELPWRFLHADVARIYAVLGRVIATDQPRVEDPLTTELQAILADSPQRRVDNFPLFQALVAVARTEPQLQTPQALLSRAVQRLAQDAGLASGLCAQVARSLGKLGADPRRPLRGFALAGAHIDATVQGWGQIEVSLARGKERLSLLFREREGFAHAFLQTDHCACVYREDGPVDTAEKAALARLVARVLDHHAARRG